MKQKFFTVVVFSLFLLGSCNRVKETVITGQIIGNADKVIYSNPNNGTCYTGFRDTMQVDENGYFELKFNLKRPSFIALWTSQERKNCILLLEPGGNYHILIDTQKEIEISGTNEEGQRLYATLPSSAFVCMNILIGNLEKESSLTVIREKIQNMKKEELEKFQKLLDENKISAFFHKLIQNDRDCYFATLESVILLRKMGGLIHSGNKNYILENGDDLRKNLEDVYTQYPLNNKDLLISSFWTEYAEYFMTYKIFLSKEDFNLESYIEIYENGTLHSLVINGSNKYLTGKFLGFFQATYIYSASIQDKFEKDLISLFEQFKKDYPKNEYSKYIKPNIDKIIDFHNKVELDNNENISFIENFENINTLEEAIKSMRGKKIYIDVWATWCGPCQEEFKHTEILKQILKDKDKDIQILYISIDREMDDVRWRNLIKYYNLEGKHIRTNENFKQELYRKYNASGTIAIPWYILIDEEGNILQKHAKKPSQIVSGGDIF